MDGERQIEVHPLPTSHAEDLVVVYLPKGKDIAGERQVVANRF